MPRFKLFLAYDGRPYAGWQAQLGRNTVQDTVEGALTRILKGRTVRIQGSGRTDAGVHALGQVAHFDVPPEARLPGVAWRRALNMNLPASIRVMECLPAHPDFHARFDALGKTYRYRIFTGEVLPPFEAGTASHYCKPLDFERMVEACAHLAGTHDFAGFAAFRGHEDGSENTVRTLWKVEPARDGGWITLTFHGSGFLYKMVRLMTGAILRVAGGRAPLTWMTDLLHRRVEGKCQHLAPPDGLYLVSVDYPDRPNPHEPDAPCPPPV
ncbi:MAG: tRNA pseudouridine(38-40) synthase TruA [Verrucomicrobiota bacterium]